MLWGCSTVDNDTVIVLTSLLFVINDNTALRLSTYHKNTP
jgi:hypothetical protein